jgi:4a-hydroxytetrahydrobiopterin dehydratase
MNKQIEESLIAKRCVSLAAGTPALPAGEISRLLSAIPEWQVVDGVLTREYTLPSYMEGVKWFALIAAMAEQEDHHPDAYITWCRVKLTLWTHTVGGLSENDFILAAKVERAWKGVAV